MKNIYTPDECPLDPTDDCKVTTCKECRCSIEAIDDAVRSCVDFDIVTECEGCCSDPCPHNPDTW